MKRFILFLMTGVLLPFGAFAEDYQNYYRDRGTTLPRAVSSDPMGSPYSTGVMMGGTALGSTANMPRQARRDHDERVQAALAFIDRHRLEDTSLERVAAAVHLSPDRLRHLFKEQLGCTISHYARTAAVWRALSQWAHGEPLTAVAHDVGFHDYAHSHHAFREMFGFPPSMLKGKGVRGGVKLIRGG